MLSSLLYSGLMRILLRVFTIISCVSFLVPLAGARTAPVDVSADSSSLQSINWAMAGSIMTLSDDGHFYPNRTVTRAEFLKTLLTAQGDNQLLISRCGARLEKASGKKTQWYDKYICAAQSMHFIDGGSSYDVQAPVPLTEAAKILAKAFELKVNASSTSPWYEPPVRALAAVHSIPTNIGVISQHLTRADVAEILWRLSTKRDDRPSVAISTLLKTPDPCSQIADAPIPGVDLQKVHDTWIGWINDVRKKLGLPVYTVDPALNRTAFTWSDISAKKGVMSHQRIKDDGYYNYAHIEQWFAAQGVTFTNVHQTTFTENIGRGPYSCSQKDCTQKLIDSLRMTFDFYMAEKGKANSAHYNSIVQPYFTLIGAGITVDPVKKTYYITTHYATALHSTAIKTASCD